MKVVTALGNLVENFVAAIVMLVFAIVSFFLTVFVVDTGAGLAGFSPSGDFVVLSATILVSAAMLSGLMK